MSETGGSTFLICCDKKAQSIFLNHCGAVELEALSSIA
jgi:hypothetical protein